MSQSFDRIKRRGPSPPVCRYLYRLDGAGYPNATPTKYGQSHRVCTDLDLCLAVLSRRVNNLFLSYRPADYSPEQLFHWAFIADDARLVACSIPREQWPLERREKCNPGNTFGMPSLARSGISHQNPMNPLFRPARTGSEQPLRQRICFRQRASGSIGCSNSWTSLRATGARQPAWSVRLSHGCASIPTDRTLVLVPRCTERNAGEVVQGAGRQFGATLGTGA